MIRHECIANARCVTAGNKANLNDVYSPTIISPRTDQKAVITSESHISHVSGVTHVSLERGLESNTGKSELLIASSANCVSWRTLFAA